MYAAAWSTKRWRIGGALYTAAKYEAMLTDRAGARCRTGRGTLLMPRGWLTFSSKEHKWGFRLDRCCQLTIAQEEAACSGHYQQVPPFPPLAWL